MEKLQVLVATMKQKDFSLLEAMKLDSDVIIANQTDVDRVEETEFRGHHAKMISTTTDGVGVNRNIALDAAKAEYVLLADDDMTYYDNYGAEILKAFEENPKAAVLLFSIDCTENGKICQQRREPLKRRHFWNILKYGTCVIAVRRAELERNGIRFSELFGGHCLYGSGEDSLFLLDCLRHGMKAYSHPFVLGTTSTDVSSWFSGYHRKYFYDKGAWLACAFPKTKWLFKWYFIFRHKPMTDLPLGVIRKEINRGIKGFRTRTAYHEA